jgi:hypothetical protein
VLQEHHQRQDELSLAKLWLERQRFEITCEGTLTTPAQGGWTRTS